MGVADEVRDPWSYVTAGLAGGMAFAVGIFPPAALGIGVAVFGAKVITGALTRSGPKRRKRPSQRERRLPVLTRTPEAAWLGRAKQAQFTFEDIAHSAHDGPIAERVRSFGEQTDQSLATLERLAGQASAIRSAMARIDPRRLAWERDRLLNAATATDDPRLLAERERSLNSVQTQLDTYQRLSGTLTMLLARLESGTLGIEGLVARLAEVVALSAAVTSSDGTTQVDELAHELEGLRAGLVEAESVSQRAMQGLAPLPAQPAGSVPTTEQPRMRRRAGGE
jgi:hypothetical protein